MKKEDIQIGKRFIRNARILVPETPVPCPEDDCISVLRRRYSQRLKRFYYACEDPGCDGSIGCNSDGSIHGIPGDSKTKQARIDAHEVFDKLWKDGHYTRGGAYRVMARKMGVAILHIGELEEDDCRKLIDLVEDHIEDLNAPEDDDDDGWFEVG